MRLQSTSIPGCFKIEYRPFQDVRGSFVKTFRATSFRELGLEGAFTESFYSESNEGVLRGMHFQLPPSDGAKLVYVLAGEVLDVALDLRVGSPAFGKCIALSLSAQTPSAAYLPRGVAHGFLVVRGPATMIYNVSSEHDPKQDAGVRWNSFGFDWPIERPTLSSRDEEFPELSAFDSPFRFAPLEVSA
jgi:dTDP-4-dehydrorhamnose 3,5-epimerase